MGLPTLTIVLHFKKCIKYFSLLFILSFSMLSFAQNKESFWKIYSIHKEDNTPFSGFTGFYMSEIFENNFHFTKIDNTLYFELPEKFELNLIEFKSLRQLNILNRDYYEMYDFEFLENTFLIKFKDNATSSDSKNTIIEFRKITEEQFNQNIAETIEKHTLILKKMSDFKLEMEQNPPFKIDSIHQLPFKTIILTNDKNKEIKLQIPEEMRLKLSGAIQNEVFDSIKIETLKDNSRIYDIDNNLYYGFSQLSIWLSTDTSHFDINRYISKNKFQVILKQDANKVMGFTITYDFENDQAQVGSFFILKYLKVKKTHIFIYADIQPIDINNPKNMKRVHEIINYNYFMSENFSIP